MLVFFDHGTPRGLARLLVGHTVKEAKGQGWDRLSHGELLAEAENTGFDVFVTPDKNIRYQQNLRSRRIAIVVLGNPRWPILRQHADLVLRGERGNAGQLHGCGHTELKLEAKFLRENAPRTASHPNLFLRIINK